MMKKLIALSITLFLINIISFAQNTTEESKEDITIQNKIVDAVQLINDGKNKEVVECLNNLKDIAPKNDAIYYYLGKAYLGLHNIEKAEIYLSKAVQIDTSNYWSRFELANLYMQTNEAAKAIAQLQKLVNISPKDAELYYYLAVLSVQTRNLQKAINYLEQVDNIIGKSERTVLMRFELLNYLGKTKEAENVLKDFVKDNISTEVLCVLAENEVNAGKDTLAKKYYNEALAIDKDYPRALIGIAGIDLQENKYIDFVNKVRKAFSADIISPNLVASYINYINNYPSEGLRNNAAPQLDSLISFVENKFSADTTVLSKVANYYSLVGNYNNFTKTLKTISNVYPTDNRLFLSYLYALYVLNNYQQMIDEINNVGLKRFPNDYALQFMLVRLYDANKNTEKAIELLHNMLNNKTITSQGKIEVYDYLGSIYFYKGDKQKAFKYLDTALKLDKNNIGILNNYAYYLALDGKSLSKAYRMSKKTIELEPKNSTYLDTFGWILHLQGKNQDAKTYYKQAMMYGGKKSAIILQHYAAVLKALGENDLAEYYINQSKNAEQ